MPRRLIALALILACCAAAPVRAVVVSGRVLGEPATPAANVNLDFIDGTGASIPLVGDTTDGLGYYAIDVPVGTYDIYYKVAPSSGWASLAVRDVTISGTTARPDVTLPFGFAVSGFVVDRLGMPVDAVDLDFDDCTTGETWLTPSDNTDPLGFYSATVPAGTWTIAYDPPVGDPRAGVVVECVAITGATTRPDVVLPDGAVITARVVDARAAPVVDANTVWYEPAGSAAHTTGDHTDATGTFSVRVPLGTYDIEIVPPAGSRLVGTLVQDVAATADRTLPDIVLADGWLVDGLVVDRSARPVPDVDTDWNLPSGPVTTGEDNTDSAGRYAVAVPTGTYDIDFDPPPGSRHVATDLVDVVVSADMTLPDVVLDAAWFITGRVVDESAQPVIDADTETRDAATGTQQRTIRDHSDALGEYLLALPDGAWDITYRPPAGSGLAAVTVRDVVVSGADRRLADVVLPREVVVSGRVEDAAGAPVVGAAVAASDPASGASLAPDATTDGAGAFALRVRAGDVELRTTPPPASGFAGDVRTLTATADSDVGVIALLPLLESLAPASGSTAGGEAATLTGRELVAGITVTLGGMPATLGTVTPTTAALTTPPHPAGVVDVVATWPDGRSATLRGAFTYISAAQDPVIRLAREADDVVITWTEAPGTARVVHGSPLPDVFDAGSILDPSVTGLSYRHAGEASRPGTLFYRVE